MIRVIFFYGEIEKRSLDARELGGDIVSLIVWPYLSTIPAATKARSLLFPFPVLGRS